MCVCKIRYVRVHLYNLTSINLYKKWGEKNENIERENGTIFPEAIAKTDPSLTSSSPTFY